MRSGSGIQFGVNLGGISAGQFKPNNKRKDPPPETHSDHEEEEIQDFLGPVQVKRAQRGRPPKKKPAIDYQQVSRIQKTATEFVAPFKPPKKPKKQTSVSPVVKHREEDTKRAFPTDDKGLKETGDLVSIIPPTKKPRGRKPKVLLSSPLPSISSPLLPSSLLSSPLINDVTPTGIDFGIALNTKTEKTHEAEDDDEDYMCDEDIQRKNVETHRKVLEDMSRQTVFNTEKDMFTSPEEKPIRRIIQGGIDKKELTSGGGQHGNIGNSGIEFKDGAIITKSYGLVGNRQIPLTSSSQKMENNFSSRVSFYESSERDLERCQLYIQSFTHILSKCDPIKDRVKYRDIQKEIDDRTSELKEAKRRLIRSKEEYLFAVADCYRPIHIPGPNYKYKTAFPTSTNDEQQPKSPVYESPDISEKFPQLDVQSDGIGTVPNVLSNPVLNRILKIQSHIQQKRTEEEERDSNDRKGIQPDNSKESDRYGGSQKAYSAKNSQSSINKIGTLSSLMMPSQLKQSNTASSADASPSSVTNTYQHNSNSKVIGRQKGTIGGPIGILQPVFGSDLGKPFQPIRPVGSSTRGFGRGKWRGGLASNSTSIRGALGLSSSASLVSNSQFPSTAEETNRVKEDKDKVKTLAILLNELHTDIWSVDTCPSCPNTPMSYIEWKMARVCPVCKISIPTSDLVIVGSTTNGSRERNASIRAGYANTSYFFQGLKRMINSSKIDLNKDHRELLRDVYCELYNRNVFNVGDVTWCLIDEILRDISKHQNAAVAKHYGLVFNITQTIRQSPILPLNIEDIKELRIAHRRVHQNWNMVLSKQYRHLSRQSFLSNPITLQLCLFVLGYPTELLAMFKPMKGEENLRNYREICIQICKLNRWREFNLISISNLKFGQQLTLSDMVGKKH